MSDKVNFSDSASIAQALKHQIRSGTHWDDLSPTAKEALDQIATSIARTVSGDGAHWDGIVSYAQAAKPTTAESGPMRSVPPVSTNVGNPAHGIEREIHKLVREIPHRNGDAT